MNDELLTCFDHNSSRSTNFFASEVVPNAARRDLSIGTESKEFSVDFDYDLSRRSAVAPLVGASHASYEVQILFNHIQSDQRSFEILIERIEILLVVLTD